MSESHFSFGRFVRIGIRVSGKLLPTMDQRATAVAILQLLLLAINAGLFVWYLIETNKLRRAVERQVEASFRQVEATYRPALIVTHTGVTAHKPRLQNIGTGLAMEVSWSLRGSDRTGMFPFIPSGSQEELTSADTMELFEAAKDDFAVIVCEYKASAVAHTRQLPVASQTVTGCPSQLSLAIN